MERLEIRFLGDTRVAWVPGENGAAPAGLRLGRQAEALLAFLLFHRESMHRREFLAELLWPDQDDTAARLSTALWRLKTALASPAGLPPLLGEANGGVGVSPSCPVWVDVVALETAVRSVCADPPEATPQERAAGLEMALNLYRGELLPRCDAAWVLPERRRLEALFCAGLKWLLDHHRAAGRVEASIAAGERLLTKDPLREDVHCALMRLFSEAGHRVSAIRQYRWCRELLTNELGVEPMPQTEAAYREVLRGNPPDDDAAPVQDAARTMALIASLRANLEDVQRKLDALQRMVSGGPGRPVR